ncbi:MAG TPA: Gfo/Idh/MocA family oxidoreductase [Ktedonobacterales bacterium]|nr:Gfo/Idh/MocA family oxidoreductase [Ktedonobacterales bacterium]
MQASQSSPQVFPAKHPIGFAIVGAGMVAHYHAEAIAQTPGAQLVAIHRADPARAAETEARYGVPCESSYAALLARSDVEVVCICTPSGLHAEQTMAAASAGKHVLVEKPMALTLADADAMMHACRQSGVLLGVAFQRRTDPGFVAAQSAIAAGALGRLVLGCVTVPYLRTQDYYDSAAWRGTWTLDGGGALMNQGIHLLDLLLWYLGDVAEVQAQMTTLAHAIEVEDCLSATLRFRNGALGSVVATTAAAPGYPHRVEVYGQRGGMQMEGEQIARWESESLPHVSGVTVASPGTAAAGAGSSPRGISQEGHRRLIADIVNAVRENRQPVVPGEEGRRSLALTLAIYQAARTGQRVPLE